VDTVALGPVEVDGGFLEENAHVHFAGRIEEQDHDRAIVVGRFPELGRNEPGIQIGPCVIADNGFTRGSHKRYSWNRTDAKVMRARMMARIIKGPSLGGFVFGYSMSVNESEVISVRPGLETASEPIQRCPSFSQSNKSTRLKCGQPAA
jgi:hypothetical protein